MSWVNGRQLTSASDGTSTYSYIYDAAGSRIMKNVGTVNHLYFYVNGMLLMEYRYNAMGDTTDVLQYFYDANGKPHAMAYNGTVYLYVTNLQGDIVALLGLDGTVSGYEYDPYGNVIASYGDIAAINPLRYRGYYFDNETGLYYLQSRYYDPVVGRFINADSYASTGQGIIGFNMFAYCQNNPCNHSDTDGKMMVGILRGGANSLLDAGSSGGESYIGAGSSGSVKREVESAVENEYIPAVIDSFNKIIENKVLQALHGGYKTLTGFFKLRDAAIVFIMPIPTALDETLGFVKLIQGIISIKNGMTKLFDLLEDPK